MTIISSHWKQHTGEVNKEAIVSVISDSFKEVEKMILKPEFSLIIFNSPVQCKQCRHVFVLNIPLALILFNDSQ